MNFNIIISYQNLTLSWYVKSIGESDTLRSADSEVALV